MQPPEKQSSNPTGTDNEISLSKHISTMIVSRLFAYSPNLKQSWVLVAIVYLFGYMTTILCAMAPDDVGEVGSLLVRIVVAVLLVSGVSKSYNYVPVASPRQSLELWLLLVPFTVSVCLAAKPLTMWIPAPYIVRIYFEEMVWYKFKLIYFFITVIIGPIYREWLYRGIILKGLLAHYSPLKAIVWSAVIFTVINVYPWHPAATFCFALAIGWVYWRTRSLWLCVFMHAINNAASFLVRIILPDTFLPKDEWDMIYKYVYTYVDIECSYYVYAIALFVCVLTWMRIKNIIVSPVIVSDAQDC